MVDLPRKRKQFVRRMREEAYYINGARVEFYRCPENRRWEWRAIGAKVKPANKQRRA